MRVHTHCIPKCLNCEYKQKGRYLVQLSKPLASAVSDPCLLCTQQCGSHSDLNPLRTFPVSCECRDERRIHLFCALKCKVCQLAPYVHPVQLGKRLPK